MTNPIEVTGVQPSPRYATGHEPQAETPVQERVEQAARASIGEQTKAAAEPGEAYQPPVNPYAPTGWKRKHRIEFDVQLPSGQLCRVMRLEREDLFRMNLLQYLDTFTPMLLDDAAVSEAGRDRQIQAAMKDNPNALANMFMAIDEVIMAAAIKPKITQDEKLVDYGTPSDWGNPRFTPVAHLDDIIMDDRMAIFASAFGKSMDDLKSVWRQTPGMGGLADVAGVQQGTE